VPSPAPIAALRAAKFGKALIRLAFFRSEKTFHQAIFSVYYYSNQYVIFISLLMRLNSILRIRTTRANCL
jgi:hypothetical protein